jgi:ribonuclease HII
VILAPGTLIAGLNDSKMLTAAKRDALFAEISQKAVSIGVEAVGESVIDEVNILQATYMAMKGALARLKPVPALVLVDGWPISGFSGEQVSIIGGDGKSAAIAAASIIAKVTRDRLMCELSEKFPDYNFKKHKGYGTKEHQEALERFGPCAIHRKSFAPVRKYFELG